MITRKMIPICFFSTVCSVVFIFLPMSVSANENDGVTILTTQVPSTHQVQIVIDGNGEVQIEGTKFRDNQKVSIPRLTRQEYQIIADKGWKIKSVFYGMDKSMNEIVLNENSFIADELNKDGNILYVIFEKQSLTESMNGFDETNENIQTGDTTNILLWEILLLTSVIYLIGIYKYITKIKTL